MRRHPQPWNRSGATHSVPAKTERLKAHLFFGGIANEGEP